MKTKMNSTTARQFLQPTLCFSLFVVLSSCANILGQAEVEAASNSFSIASVVVPRENLSSATDGNGTFVAAAQNGSFLTSTDGLRWSSGKPPVPTFIRSVTYGSGLFVAVGGSYVDKPGVILTSRDGATWTARKSRTRRNLYGVVYGDGIFVAVGDDGQVVSSSDGVCWKSGRVPNTGLLTAIAHGNGRFVAVGESGTLVASSNGIHWDKSSLGSWIYFSKVDFTKGVFIAFSGNATVASSDGITWRVPNTATNLLVRTKS